MLITAAARTWNVPEGSAGVLEPRTHGGSNRTLTYAQLAPAMANVTPPNLESVRLKIRDFTIIASRDGAESRPS